MEKESCLTALNESVEVPLTLDSLLPLSQRNVSFSVDSHSRKNLLEKAETSREKARLNSVGLPKSGLWLNVILSKNLGLHLKSREFRVCIQYRMSLDIFIRSGPFPACTGISDSKGDHAIACGYAGERISRHNFLRETLFQYSIFLLSLNV